MTPDPKVVEAVARWYASCAFEMDIDRMTAEQRAMCETEAATFLDTIAPQIIADAVKAEKQRIIDGLEYEASVTPCDEDAQIVQGCADLVRHDFSYEDVEAAAIRARGNI